MDPLAFWLSVAGMVSTATVGGLGIYFTFRARTQPYRSLLYQKQVNLLAELLEAIDEVQYVAVSFASATDEHSINAEAKTLPGRLEALEQLQSRAALLLPADVFSLLAQYRESSAKYFQALLEGKSQPARDALTEMSATRMAALLRARELLGSDPLTEESARILRGAGGDQVAWSELVEDAKRLVDSRSSNLGESRPYVRPSP